MGRLIDISWPAIDIKVVAELNDEKNPELCEEFYSNLPFTVLQAHPVVSGESLYAWTPIVSTAPIRHRERIVDCPIGRMRYSQATGNKFSIQYGKGLEPLAQPVLGQVQEEYCHLLPKVGKEVWENVFWRKEKIFVVVTPHGSSETNKPPVRPANLPAAATLFLDEADKIQMEEPEDLRKIRLGLIGDTGSYGQYFTNWDFANGMLRDYIMYTIYPLLRIVDKLEPPEFYVALEELDIPYSEYLGHSGLEHLDKMAAVMRTAVKEAKSKEDVKHILRAFLKYGNRLCAWSYHYFPWYLGMFYNRQINGQEFPGRWKQATGAMPRNG